MTAFPASTWTRPPRQRTGVLGLGILAAVVSTWLLVPQLLALLGTAGSDLDGGDAVELVIVGAVPASLVLAVGAVASRIVWLLVLAIPVLAVHGLALVVTAIVVGASGSTGLAVLGRLADAVALGLALAAVVAALVATAAARAGDRREGAGWVAALVLVGVATIVVLAAPYLEATEATLLALLVSDTLVIALLVAGVGVAGIRSSTARWAAGAVLLVAALWVVLLETVVVPWAAPATIAIAIVRALLLVLAAVLVAMSTRWLARPHGVAPPVAAPRAPQPAPAAVAPPVVPEREPAPPVTAEATGGTASATTSTTPGVVDDADRAIDQGDREVPESSPGPDAAHRP